MDAIPAEASGKYRYVVSHVPLPSGLDAQPRRRRPRGFSPDNGHRPHRRPAVSLQALAPAPCPLDRVGHARRVPNSRRARIETISPPPSTGCAGRRTCATASRTPAGCPPAGASRTAGCRAIPRPAATSSRRSSRPPRHSGAPELVAARNRIIDWELSIQHPDGAFPGHFGEPGSQPVIFNTGSDHARHAGRLPAARAARNAWSPRCAAGHWLARPAGCRRLLAKVRAQRRAAHLQHARHLGAARHRLDCRRTGPRERGDNATSTGRWRQQTASGWFANNAFTPDRAAFHPHDRLRDPWVPGMRRVAGRTSATSRRRRARPLGRGDVRSAPMAGSPARYDRRAGAPARRYCCLTGVAQMSLNWIRLAQEGRRGRACATMPAARSTYVKRPAATRRVRRRSSAARSRARRRSGGDTRCSNFRTGRRNSSPTR